jgi:hypothetical protein
VSGFPKAEGKRVSERNLFSFSIKFLKHQKLIYA